MHALRTAASTALLLALLLVLGLMLLGVNLISVVLHPLLPRSARVGLPVAA